MFAEGAWRCAEDEEKEDEEEEEEEAPGVGAATRDIRKQEEG